MIAAVGVADLSFDTVLVANRGEVACRIMATLRRMGLRSVAVFAESDRSSLHIDGADRAVSLGDGGVDATYLDVDRIIAIALDTGAQAIHPGYGFLSERAELADAAAAAGIAFVGPTADQLRAFGRKDTARRLAAEAGVPLLAGSGILADIAEALPKASEIGYPVIIKSSAGGGGIGMEVCRSADELPRAFERVQRSAGAAFGSTDVFVERYIERARHIEVQIFGDGRGGVIVLGDRECSAQRRNQKVVEEAPAPNLPATTRRTLADAARALAESVDYRSAGTVEFVVDADSGACSFLEVNTRLQVEHGVTEAVCGVDLVEWMVRLAAGDASPLETYRHRPSGHAIEARLYAERPDRGFLPSAGLLTNVQFPEDIRVDTWVETGTEVTPFYDPLLAKVIAVRTDRADAIASLDRALQATRLDGIETNLGFVRTVIGLPEFGRAEITTSTLESLEVASDSIEVIEPGRFTTVQDHPGRVGYWAVGVPPSGPMDDRSFRLGNQVVGNQPGAAGLELTISGPTLRFGCAATVCLAGAPVDATLDGVPVDRWQPITVPAGSTLTIGSIGRPGCRAYLLVRGGIDVPPHLGSRSTFTLGKFGGHGGRTLRAGDMLPVGDPGAAPGVPVPLAPTAVPELTSRWEVGVLPGPHGSPDYFTSDDIDMLHATDWEVHYNSARTGVRLIGPKPTWARSDGGEAGLHPSNIHDNAYAIGAIDFTGDMPIILGPDGPSLGGFVCPATVVADERWKLGQLSPGDTVRFVPIDPSARPILARADARDDRPEVTYRRAGDEYLLVEYGPNMLDLDLRFRVHALMTWITDRGIDGVVDLTPGIRSLQVHIDRRTIDVDTVLGLVTAAESELPAIDDMVVPSRIVHLPLSWDDPATLDATRRYMQSVRDDAPWCPHNLEFIRRINGLDSIEDVRRVVLDASYLVLGLGDVYLGAPVATPVDPRHRLVTTKYNPARTWTPENAVGIGGAYLCIYGMEGPGGYQFIGRTVPVWNRWKVTEHFESGVPWLLRFFDQIRWFEVTAAELLDWRRDLVLGRARLDIEDSTFSLHEHHQFLAQHAAGIAEAKLRQQRAFDAERRRWEASGEFERAEEAEGSTATSASPVDGADDVPAGTIAVRAPMGASVWHLDLVAGVRVEAGEVLVSLEAMKMETVLEAPVAGTIIEVRCVTGQVVVAGQVLAVLRP